jgi:hypothetical protein
VVLGIHVVYAAHVRKHPPGIIGLTALQEGVGVSERNMKPTVMMAAGTAASARLTL